MKTGLPMNAIIDVSSLNFLLKFLLIIFLKVF